MENNILDNALNEREKFDIVEIENGDFFFRMTATDCNNCRPFISILKDLKADFFEGFYPSYLELNEKIYDLPCEEVFEIRIWSYDDVSEVVLYESSLSQLKKVLKSFKVKSKDNVGIRIEGVNTVIELSYNPILKEFFVDTFELYFSEWESLIKVLKEAKLISREDNAYLLDTRIKLRDSDEYEDAFRRELVVI